ncbi:MAG: replication-associated recombination protein A [Saprospiraceae bacterium]|nr:replication-associated recombination protein A [Saprospiraceae bacterium]
MNTPLAERMRPKNLDEYYGQTHLVGKDATLLKVINSGLLPSIILWGPPGVGKTTLARLMAEKLQRPFFTLSAINSGVKDIREIFEKAEKHKFFNSGANVVLFIDEIHRFNKSQQDSLLGAVEKGTITLIGATTENPSFEVIPALLSRCQVYVLEHLGKDELIGIIDNAIKKDEYFSLKNIEIVEYDAMLAISGGDARKLLNILELVVNSVDETSEKIVIDNDFVHKIITQNAVWYDKNGEQHYDIISAFIKSLRGSDPNAAVYWLARMLKGGEDIKFIARRMLILAAEDIGLANPNALLMANTAFQAATAVGMPEARIILSQAAIYLATSPKSNSAYMAIEDALAAVERNAAASVPLHLRNAPTKLMKSLNYGSNYKYAHEFDQNFIAQEYLPKEEEGTVFYAPSKNAQEQKIKEFLNLRWRGKYDY